MCRNNILLLILMLFVSQSDNITIRWRAFQGRAISSRQSDNHCRQTARRISCRPRVWSWYRSENLQLSLLNLMSFAFLINLYAL